MSGGTRIIEASNRGPGPALDVKMRISAIVCRAGKCQRMPQTNGIVRLIQLKTNAFGFTEPKEFADYSAVMDRSFG